MKYFLKVILISLGIVLSQFSFSQESKTLSSENYKSELPLSFDFDVTATTKGISTLPNMTLGKPAIVFDMMFIRKKLSFEPQFRFAMSGRPWAFQFWWRYNAIETSKFKLNIGARPSFNFKSKTVTTDNMTYDGIIVQRNLGIEVIPSFKITDIISISSHYIYLYGLDPNMAKHTNFVSFQPVFSNIPISNDIRLKISPQIYYLRMDRRDGVYYGSTFSLTKKDFPLTLSSLVNKELKSNLTGSFDFLWNVSLTYSLNKQYIKLK